jgi:hypothetical protein
MTGTNFLSERLNNVLDELEHVRKELRSRSEKLAKAEEALRFYADVRNYNTIAANGKSLVGFVITSDYDEAANPGTNTFVAGKKAREYFSGIPDT